MLSKPRSQLGAEYLTAFPLLLQSWAYHFLKHSSASDYNICKKEERKDKKNKVGLFYSSWAHTWQAQGEIYVSSLSYTIIKEQCSEHFVNLWHPM